MDKPDYTERSRRRTRASCWVLIAAGAGLAVSAVAQQPGIPLRQTEPSQAPAASRPPVASPQPAARPPAAQPAAAPAAVRPASSAPAALAAPAVPGVVDVQATSLSYDAERRLMIARGDVRVTSGADSVSADYAEVDTAAEQVYARGNLVIQYQGNVWRGEEANYNFRTGVGDFGGFDAFLEPWHMRAAGSRRVSPSVMEVDGVMLTTCDPDRPEYSIRASWASIEDSKYLRAKNLRFQFGPVPFFWFPYLRANLEELAKFEFTPGYSSTMGAFLLTAYNHPLSSTFKSRTHFDVRQKRGIGLGQDILWKDPGNAFKGMVRGYYTHDSKPWKNDTQRAEREDLIDKSRYWLHLSDRHNLTDRDYLITELNYVSDPWMLSDFFDDIYQKNVQPENRVTLSHRGDHYTAGVGLNMRLNDFYGNVDRLPEVFLNFNRQQILDTPLYYEGENTLGYLQRVFPKQSDKEDYEAFRLDSYHMVYWPTRHFGFLSLIPRAGYRGTLYSKTLETRVVTNVVAQTDEAGAVIGTELEEETLLRDGSATWRHLPELGVESSFKAFGNLYSGYTGIEEDRDLRHIAEPYANYTLRLKPNIQPGELWQFDSIDRLDKRNDIALGMRNYLQTKRRNSPHNLLYLDVFTTLLLDPDDGQNALNDIGFRSELRPFSWFSLDFDGTYDTQDTGIRVFNTQAEFRHEDYFSFALDYRYTRDVRQAVAGDLNILPEQRWSGRIYARMDIDESQLEEHSYFVIHRTRCLGIGLGLRVRPDHTAGGSDNYTVWLRIWPLAFPEFSSSLGN